MDGNVRAEIEVQRVYIDIDKQKAYLSRSSQQYDNGRTVMIDGVDIGLRGQLNMHLTWRL